MAFARLHGPAQWALLAGLALGAIGLLPAAAEAKRIKIRTRSDPGEAWLIGRAAAAPARGEEAAAGGGVVTPGRAEPAQARARAALAAERGSAVGAAAVEGEPGPLDGMAGP